ncbi:Mitochondrial phosphate carrier protein [Mycena indigotica]|uniref:Mitochondrial phosphate carrier protein n=1 Tax=Mycena indigotica TaxID=2126181 RepID=A0A8H6WAP2_9AGAR|nr:Mitochondrial phosphate carrier protein [Mycena indigotica]KAF7311789.1 Mitochondrial phosphate carrier protein [Mycena indigotica]
MFSHLFSSRLHPSAPLPALHIAMVLGPRVRQLLPYINFAVAAGALAFQTTVLYPWHHELDEAFRRLKAEQGEVLREYHQLKIERFKDLEKKMGELERRLGSSP